MLEEMLLDRLSFRRFIGLRVEDKTPDETTFVVFRKRLRKHGHSATLFDKTVEILTQRGVILEEGTCVDATIIEAPRGRKRTDGTSTKDRTASYTKKHGTIYHGFKAHIATDRNGIIKDYRFDTAGVHDSRHIDDLITDERHSVWADSAYMNIERKKRLREQGIFCGIAERRGRGQKELTVEQKWHNRLVAGIRAVVEHPFAWMKNTGYRRVRYRGLGCNGMDFALHAIAYNFKRSFSLQQAMV
jgi:IS5 family transposase